MAITAPPADAVRAYADAVLAGEVVAGRLVRLACGRHLDDLAHGAERGLVWDAEAAADKIAFFSFLNLPTGEPFHLAPSQQFIIGSTFGWKRSTARAASGRTTSKRARATARRRWPPGSGSSA